MKFDTLRYEVADGIGRVTLDRPDRLNALTYPMIEELHQVFRRVDAGLDEVRALVLTGAGRAFSSGADIVSPRPQDPDHPKDSLRDYYNPAYQLLQALPVPTVAAVNGPCAGAGMSLALSCDVVVAARSAYFLAAFVNIGLVPDAGASWLVPQRIGNARAAGMLLLGERIPAQDAADWGLIWKCVDDDALGAEVERIVRRFAAGPTRTYDCIKQLLRSAATSTAPVQMQLEAQLQGVVRATEDAAEARRAFAEKRPPVFKGR